MIKQGTVAWLIEELKKFPQDMEVLIGDRDRVYYSCSNVETNRISDGRCVADNDPTGGDVVCINAD